MKKSEESREDLVWEVISTEPVLRDEWIDFRKSVYRFPNGGVYGPFYSYSSRDYAVVVASDTEGNYLCVRQFRHGIRGLSTEFPAGGIEGKDGRASTKAGAVSEEEALAAAKRELLEETGYISEEWTHLLTLPSSATISDNYAYLFMARNCRLVSEQSLDETEFIRVLKLSAQELERLITEGEFGQAVHIAAWLLSLRR